MHSYSGLPSSSSALSAPDTTQSLSMFVDCGGGVICVCGPRGVGKTTAVMRCIFSREKTHGAKVAIVTAHSLTHLMPSGGSAGPGGSHSGPGSSSLSLLVTAGGNSAERGGGGAHASVLSECYRQFAVGLAGQQFTMAMKPTPFLAGAAIRYALGESGTTAAAHLHDNSINTINTSSRRPPTDLSFSGQENIIRRSGPHHAHSVDSTTVKSSQHLYAARFTAEAVDAAYDRAFTCGASLAGEVHLVLDDAGLLSSSVLNDISSWVSSLGLPRVNLWIISSTPVSINGCWRYKFMTRPDARTVGLWLKSRMPSGIPSKQLHLRQLEEALHLPFVERSLERSLSRSYVSEYKAERGASRRLSRDSSDGASNLRVVQSRDEGLAGHKRARCENEGPHLDVGEETDDNQILRNKVSFGTNSRRIMSAIAVKETDIVMSRAAEAATYYLTHNPMQSSIVARDVRTLLKAVHQLADELRLSEGLEDSPTEDSTSYGASEQQTVAPQRSLATLSSALTPHRVAILSTCNGDPARKAPNPLAYSTAWSKLTATFMSDDAVASEGNKGLSSGGLSLSLPHQVARLGPSAQLLCVALFYCGTVAPARDHEVFREMGSSRGPSRLRRQGSSKDTVLSSATHSISSPRLWSVYSRLPRMIDMSEAKKLTASLGGSTVTTAENCPLSSGGLDGVGSANGLAQLKPTMCLSPSIALHHLGSLATWGVLTTSRSGLHTCHLSLEDARVIGAVLGIDLLLLVPTKR